MDILKKIFIALGSMDRRFIFLLVGFSVLLPKLYPDFFTLPIKASSHSERVFAEIDALENGAKVLVSFEYGPSTKPEIHPSAIALLNHLFSKDIKVYAVALWPDGNFMATEAFSAVAEKYGKQYGKDYVNLGYKPGEILLAGFDLVDVVFEEMDKGYVQLTVDQQPYYQGYMSVHQLYLMNKYGLSALDINTGKAMIGPDDVKKIRSFKGLSVR